MSTFSLPAIEAGRNSSLHIYQCLGKATRQFVISSGNPSNGDSSHVMNASWKHFRQSQPQLSGQWHGQVNQVNHIIVAVVVVAGIPLNNLLQNHHLCFQTLYRTANQKIRLSTLVGIFIPPTYSTYLCIAPVPAASVLPDEQSQPCI